MTRTIGLIVGLALASLTTAWGTDYVWIGGGDGTNWTDSANWIPPSGWPDGASDRAWFTNGNASVILPADLTLGALTLGTNYCGTNSLAGNLNLVNTGGFAGSLTLEGGLFVTGKDVVSGIAADGQITIGTNGTMIVRRSSTVGEGLGQTITAGAMTVDGLLSADYEGFDDDNVGPSPGSGYLSPGGCHGGITGRGSRTTYGSATNPVSLGSRGNEGAFGGGAISLAVSGVLAVNGTISANGRDHPGSGGAGAGGSINLKAAQLVGTGMVRARGGDSANRHGGGGGRISVTKIGTNHFAGSIQVHGGLSGNFGYPHSSAGTIAFPDDYDLTLGGAGNMLHLRLGMDEQGHEYHFNTIVIETNGVLELDGNRKLNDGLGGPTVVTARIIEVQPGGQISADSLGFKEGEGYAGNIGSTYGGRGGYDNRKPTYGCFTNPVVFGSGGGTIEREGGGVVRLQATEILQIDGVVSSDASDHGYYCGSGGSVNLIAPELRGSGVIRANGGSSAWRGGGGGGRISLVQIVTNRFSGTIEALPGGSSYNPRPFAGTIAFPAGYDLTLGGEGHMQSLRLGSDDDNEYDFGAIVINDGGLLEIDGNPMRESFFGGAATLRAASLDVQAGGTISALGLGFGNNRAAPENYVNYSGGPHGGGGGGNPLTYGSITNPVNLGSGSYAGGGGGIILQVATTCNLDGIVTASAPDASSYGGGAGGTVNITASALSGGGEISADAGNGSRHGGGGGRIAIKAPMSSFSGTLSALGGSGHTSYGGHGAAGTIFTDVNGARRLSIDNDKVHEDKPTYTWLPSVTNLVTGSELEEVTLEVTNFGRVALTNNVTVGDLYLRGEIVSLFLNGWTLTVNSRYHGDWGHKTLVLYDDGEIVWKRSGTIILVQ